MTNTLEKKGLRSLLTIMLFDHTCVNISFPVLTLICFDASSHLFAPGTPYHIRSLWYGLFIAIPHFLTMFAGPFLSMLSDTLGRRKILLLTSLGAATLAMTTGLGVLTGALWLVIIGRVIGGLISRTNPVAQAIVGDLSDHKTKIVRMAHLQFAISVGAFVGPLIGGYFARRFFFPTLNFSLPFFIATVFGLAGFFITQFYFKESLTTPKPEDTKSSFISLLKLLRKPMVLHTTVLLLISQLSWSLYYQFTPPVLKTLYEFSASNIGLFVGLIALWLAITTGFLIRPLHRRLSSTQMMHYASYAILTGLLITDAACLAHPLKNFVWLGALPVALGDVILYTCLSARFSSAVPAHHQGKVMALCFIIVSATWGLTGLLGGIMMSIHPLMPLLIAPIGIALLIVLNQALKKQAIA